MSEFTTVARRGDIPAGKGKAYQIHGRTVAVFNTGSEYYAIDDLCPHMGASLADGDVEDKVVTCPWHAWRFSVCDGTWCDNRTMSIDSFEVRLVDENIQVRVPKPTDQSTESVVDEC